MGNLHRQMYECAFRALVVSLYTASIFAETETLETRPFFLTTT